MKKLLCLLIISILLISCSSNSKKAETNSISIYNVIQAEGVDEDRVIVYSSDFLEELKIDFLRVNTGYDISIKSPNYADKIEKIYVNSKSNKTLNGINNTARS